MSKDDKKKENLKRLLHQKRDEIVKEIEDLIGMRMSTTIQQKFDSALDDGDLSVLNLSEGVDYKFLEMKYKEYKSIADAFRKLDAGTYGTCEECGNEIDEKRLKVIPFARLCIDCKRKQEELEDIEKERGLE
ncbi:MAG: TraR/DksA C4-type zinc finger protein [Nitrospirae bacterium]|nr:TraR/DksA C4-type zinc finger protein [Nitrospirota bacterium]